jgi:D-3-phosphoglycerate dehydrogenase
MKKASVFTMQNKKLHILVNNPEYFDEEAMKILNSIGNVTAKNMTNKELLKKINLFDILVIRVDTKLTKEILDKATNLKLIGSATTGLNHIDINYAKKKKIKILNLHGTHTLPTAQHTIALMLSLSRNIPWAFESLKNGKWERYRFIGTQLDEKTLGIIGLGRIGSQVAKYAKAFGMNVIAYDPFIKKNKSVSLVSLNTLLKTSDIISLHPMLTESSRNMLQLKQLKLMKRTAFLINTSRGEVINSKDLLVALKKHVISGAALDVFPEEPFLKKGNRFVSYAQKNKNLIITPHIGASTKEAVHMAGFEIAMKIKKELKL